jgi:hypothetical protein
MPKAICKLCQHVMTHPTLTEATTKMAELHMALKHPQEFDEVYGAGAAQHLLMLNAEYMDRLRDLL